MYNLLTFQKLNPWNHKEDVTHVPVSKLTSLVNDSAALKPIPDKKFYLAMDFNHVDDYHFHDERYYPLSAINDTSSRLLVPQINHVSLILPPSPPLTQFADLDKVCSFKFAKPRSVIYFAALLNSRRMFFRICLYFSWIYIFAM